MRNVSQGEANGRTREKTIPLRRKFFLIAYCSIVLLVVFLIAGIASYVLIRGNDAAFTKSTIILVLVSSIAWIIADGIIISISKRFSEKTRSKLMLLSNIVFSIIIGGFLLIVW